MHQRTLLQLALACLLLGGLTPRSAGGHEVPARVAVTSFVRPEGDVLWLVVRVPLAALRDVDWPIDERGVLDAVAARPLLRDAAQLWVADYLSLWEDGRALAPPQIAATRLSLPSDRSFATYDEALAHFTGPLLGADVTVAWQVLWVDVLLQTPITDDGARFAIAPALGHLGQRTTSVLTLVPQDGRPRPFVYEGDPGRIELDPSVWRAAGYFVQQGLGHILGGIDHLLFVLCLVLPVRRLRPLVLMVTAFTVAHSLTLGAAALGMIPTAAWFPPLVELVIALSIVLLAVENIVLPAERLEGRWKTAFGFGLIHGFGFSFALAEQLQFAGAHLTTALAAFNVGVELGQILAILLAVPVLAQVHRWVGAERRDRVTVVAGAFIAYTAWRWVLDRFETVVAYRDGFVWPVLDATFALGALRVGLLLSVALAVGLLLQHIMRRFGSP